jgi:predicted GIY-YIG superfamily endonuclease
LIAVVYATTSGSTPAMRMFFKICTEKRSVRELIFLQVQQSRKKRREREREINQWPGKAKDLLEKEMVVEIMKRH